MAIVFNGTSNLLSWAGNIRSALPITLFGWVKRVNTSSLQTPFSTANTANMGFVRAATLAYNVRAYGDYSHATGYGDSVQNGVDTSEFAWNPLMVTVSSSVLSVWFGAAQTTGATQSISSADTLSAHNIFTIGGLGSSPSFIGEISDVAVWNTALGDTEWATLKAGTAPEGVSAGSLVEAWALRELGDYTGVNGRTLVATGTLARSSTDPFTRTTAASASLSTTLDPAAFSGTASVSPAASLSISTADAIFSGSASVSSDGVLTLPVLKNNTGTVLASETGATVHVYATSGAHVVTKTGQTTNGSGVMSVTDPLIVASTQYRVVIVLASGAEGMDKVTAA